MDLLPIQYLHLETGIIPLFILMVLLTQLARSSELGYYVSGARMLKYWMVGGFGFLVLAFGAVLGRVSPLLAVELSAGTVLSLLHPVNALCFFVHLLYLRPWEIVTTNPLLLSLPRGVAMLCFFSWLIHPKCHGKPNARTLRLLNLLLVFSVWLFLTTFFSPRIAETQSDWFSLYFKSLIVFVMCLYFIDSERSLSEFKLTFVISALALMVVRLYQYHTEGSELIRLQTGGMFGDSNDLAAIIVMALPFALTPLFKKTAGLGQKLVGVLFGALSLIVIWYSQSRGAMLALAAQAFTVSILNTSGKKLLSTCLLTGLLGLGYFVVLKTVHRESEEMEVSSESRITYWKTAVNMTLRHPVFGVGYGLYPENYDAYSVGTKYEWGRRTAHSSWFLAFAESGIPGGLLFVSFFVIVFRTAWRSRRMWPDHFYSVVGTGVVISFLSHTYGMDIYLLAGLVMAADSLKELPHGGV